MSYVFEQNLLNQSKYRLKAPYAMEPIGICIHNTYNDASADNEVTYHNRNDSQTGYHVAIDDKKVIQCLPFNRNAFHAGE